MGGSDAVQPYGPIRIFIVAGEASGDALGARLMQALGRLTEQGDAVVFDGIGGPEMEATGLRSRFPMSELSVAGLIEVLPHIRRLSRRIDETVAAVRSFKPDVLVTIDSPGFNKRLAARLGTTDFPKVHYVAPTVWAWRPKRATKFKTLFDRLLCLLPFEPPYFKAVGLDAPFVGHSVLESGADMGDGAPFRNRHGISRDTKVICVLPGSRKGEATRLLPVFRETIARVAEAVTDGITVVMPLVPHLCDLVETAVADWPVPVHIVTGGHGEKYDAMAASNAALAASGTVSLELAMANVPTVVAYRVNPLTYEILNRLIYCKYVNLINLLADDRIVPELLQKDCTPNRIAPVLESLLGEDGQKQIARAAQMVATLSPADGVDPSMAAARAVLETVTRGKAKN